MFHLVYIVIGIQQVQFSQKLEAEYLYKYSEVKWVILLSMSWRTTIITWGVSIADATSNSQLLQQGICRRLQMATAGMESEKGGECCL